MQYETMRALDLNLLVTLDVLLRERNVTRSAEKLGITQPAASGALARLRQHFGDELLHRTGKRYELTPLAAQLLTHTGSALSAVARVFEASTKYDPDTSTREFKLLVSDYSAAVFGEALTRRLATRAPNVSLRLQLAGDAAPDNAGEFLKTVDGVLLSYDVGGTETESVDLFEDEWVAIAARDNPAVADRLTLADLRTMPWVLAHDRATTATPAMEYLTDRGIEPTVVSVVDGFMPVPFLVAGTNRIALIQRRLAEKLAPAAQVRVLPLPGRPERFTQTFCWHPLLAHDRAHQWLRSELAAAAEDLTGQVASSSSTSPRLTVASDHTPPRDGASRDVSHRTAQILPSFSLSLSDASKPEG